VSDAQGYEVGQIVNGHRWTGHEWEPVKAPEADAAALAPPTGPPVAPPAGPTVDSPLLGTPQFGGPAYGAPAGAPPAVNQFGTPIDPGSPPLAPPDGAPMYGAPTTGGGQSPAAAAAPMFLIGTVVAIGASIAGIAVLNSRGGGLLWWGAYFVTFALWRRAWSAYQQAKGATGRGLGTAATVVAGVCVVAAVGSATAFGLAFVSDKSAPALAESVGSCFTRDGDKVFVVACDSADAQYVALTEVTNEADCPATTIGDVESPTAGRFLCLGLK
jgi:hypothetical protein